MRKKIAMAKKANTVSPVFLMSGETIIGVDPSSKNPAFAIINSEGVITNYGKIPLYPLSSWYRIIASTTRMFVEGQYLDQNVTSSIKLAHCAGEIVGIARLIYDNPLLVQYIQPTTWQSAILGVNIKTIREARKRMSKIAASGEVGVQVKDNDISDAICIARYGYIITRKNKLYGNTQKKRRRFVS